MPHQIPLAKNTSTNKFQELKVNSDGKLEVSDSVVNVNTDGLETLVSAGNNTLSSIDNKVILPSALDSDRLKVYDSAVIGSLAQINNNVDELEGLVGDTNSKIDAMRASHSLTDLNSSIGLVRQDLTDGSTKAKVMGADVHNGQFQLRTDGDGHLQVDVLSGGGGDASAANQTSMITELTAIKTAVELLDDCKSGSELQVDVVSSALPTGAATLAKQDEIKDKIVLPTTLGQKANSNCLATCRSSTTGAYDLSARTTIGTASTSTKILCDSDGKLVLSPNHIVGVKLEDLSSTLNADLAGHTRTLAVGLRARTDITDHTAGKFLLCDSAGKLSVNNNAITTGANWLSSASIANGAYSDALDINNASAVQIFGSSTTNVSGGLQIFGGNVNDGTSDFFPLHNQIDATTPLSLTQNQVGVNNFQYGYLKNPPRYLRIYNNSGSTATLKLKVSTQ